MGIGSISSDTGLRRIRQAVISMGLSSAITLLLSAVRAKIVAVELGASGVGVLGIVTTAVVLAGTALGGGLGGSGVRAVAAAVDEDAGRRLSIQIALIRGSFLLATLAAPLVALAWWIWGDRLVPQVSPAVLAPWVAIAVSASIASAGNSALLNGLGRIHALAASSAGGGLVGTLLLLVLVPLSHQWALIAAFAAVPVATWVITRLMVASTRGAGNRVPARIWSADFRGMLVLGLAVSSSVIFTNATQLIARVFVSKQLDTASAGYLQSCFAIGAVYLGFVLNALGAEYYPRVSALRGDRARTNQAVHAQVRIVLTLGSPVIVWAIVLAPWMLSLLYSAEFQRAHTLLRLFLLGDVFKLVGWCIGYLLLAREAKRKFFYAELSWNVFFLLVLIPAASLGLNVAGFAYLTAYFLYLLVSLALAAHETRFVLEREDHLTIAGAALTAAAAFACAESGSVYGMAVAVVIASGCTVAAAARILLWGRSHATASAESLERQ